MVDSFKMTQSEYAQHRRISQPRIAKLISQGKLDGAYIKKGRRYFINPAAADELLKVNRDPIHDARLRRGPQLTPKDKAQQPAAANGKTLNEAARLNMWYRAALMKIKYEKESGALISKDQVTKQAARVGALLRTHLEGLPSKLAMELAGINNPKKAAEMLRREIKAVLTAISQEVEKL